MRVSAESVQARAQFLQNAVSGLGSGQVSRNQLPSQGLSQADLQTLQAAFDYLAKRGVVTPQNIQSLLGQAAQNATRADSNSDGFISNREQQNGLGSVSRPLVRAAADGFDNATQAAGQAGATQAASPGGGAGAQNINNALNRLDVEHNRKYLPTGTRGTSSRVTHCNQFAQDALRGIGVPRGNIPGGNANNMNHWLNNQGQQHGWRKVSAAEAQRMANSGHPVLASYNNRSGPHGHVAVVRPGHNDGKVHIAQAGGHNYNDTTVNKGFGRHAPEYFVYDGPVNGHAQAPTRGAGSRAAPSSAAPAGSAAPGATVGEAAARAAATGATNGANGDRPITGLNAALMLANKPKVSLKAGEAAIDLNGTKYTAIEGRAADNHISIESKRKFDPLTEPGIALTTAQAKALGVKVGDSVNIRDTKTGKTVSAVYYDNAGTKADGMKHFEVDPALADQLGINYRNRRGNVVDAVTNSSQVDNRFVIEK